MWQFNKDGTLDKLPAFLDSVAPPTDVDELAQFTTVRDLVKQKVSTYTLPNNCNALSVQMRGWAKPNFFVTVTMTPINLAI